MPNASQAHGATREGPRDYNDSRLDMVGAKAVPSDLGPQTTARKARSSDVPTWQDVAQ